MIEPMIELREFTPHDSPLLMTWIDGPTELLAWAGPTFTWPLDDRQLRAYAAESMTTHRHTWMGVDPASGRAVCHASLRIGADGATARLGRVLVAPDARSTGVGLALLNEVMTLAFGPLKLKRLELGVFSHNTRALALHERLGFGIDRVLDDVEQVDGRSWSALQMSLTNTDWSGRLEA